MVEVNQKGVAVRNLDGSYVFYPGYDPAEDEKCLAVPLDTGENYLVGIAGNDALQAEDPARVMPVQGGGMMAASNTGDRLPFTVTPIIPEKSAAVGYTEFLSKCSFYWDGSSTVYLSGSATGTSVTVQVNDGLLIKSPRGTYEKKTDPYIDEIIELSGVQVSGRYLIQEGTNNLEFTIKNNYGNLVNCQAVYLIQV